MQKLHGDHSEQRHKKTAPEISKAVFSKKKSYRIGPVALTWGGGWRSEIKR
jgi:hypothetical protein